MKDRYKMSSANRLKLMLAIAVSVIFIGVLGYRVLEDVSFFDALYMTIITLSTVGYGEVIDLHPAGKIFTVFLIVFGILSLSLLAATMTQFIVEGEVQNLVSRRKFEKRASKMKDHIILCGLGQVGHVIARVLKERGVDFVIIENNPEVIETGDDLGYIVIQGDATDESVLQKAHIDRARCLITATGDDAMNVYITLTARQLRDDLFIVSRGGEINCEGKLKRAGADRVIMPHLTGAHQMAHTAVNPNVIDFIEFATRDSDLEYSIEEFTIQKQNEMTGKSLRELNLSGRFGLIVIGIRREGKMIFNPSADEKLRAGDVLIVIGRSKQMSKLQELSTAGV